MKRDKIATFYDIALEEIDALIRHFEEKALHIQNAGPAAKEDSNFPTARSTASTLEACKRSIASMKSDVASGNYDATSLGERTLIIAEYLGLCDKEAKIMGSEGIVGAGVAWSVLATNDD